MKSENVRKPRMEAVFRDRDEFTRAQATLRQFNLSFSEFARFALCKHKLPPHSFDFEIYRIAVQFQRSQSHVLDNLRYLRAQARLGRIEGADLPLIEAAISENRAVNQFILGEISNIRVSQSTIPMLEQAQASNPAEKSVPKPRASE